MKLRHPLLIRIVAILAALLVRIWMGTVRQRFWMSGRRVPPSGMHAGGHCIYVFWHESILAVTAVRLPTRLYGLISQHADGELIAQVCEWLGFGVVRGSSTRGGMAALRDLIRKAEFGHLAVTPDGPRGPRRRVQLGVIFLAAQTGMPIVPAGIGFTHAWRARSWDRFAVPLPASTYTCVGGELFHVPPGAKREEMESFRALVEQELLRVTADAEYRAALLARS